MKKTAAILLTALIAMPGATVSAGEGTGSFSGLKGHTTTGQVAVVRTVDGWEVRLEDDFTFDGAPDPRIGFGTAGKFAANTDFEPLRSKTGAQVYMVPAGVDPTAYDEVYIWCRKYSVPLGVARIAD